MEARRTANSGGGRCCQHVVTEGTADAVTMEAEMAADPEAARIQAPQGPTAGK
jgi:hypothetical protein